MARFVSMLCCAGALTLLASNADAQERRGFWVAIGASPGFGQCTQVNARLDPPRRGCSAARKTGLSGFVAAGGTIKPRVLLGLEANGWTHSNADTVRQYGLATAVVQVYPLQALPVFLKGGIGVGRYAEDRTETQLLAASGFGFQFGAGGDWVVTSKLHLMPFAQILIASGIPASIGPLGLQDPLDFDVIQVGIAARWH